MTPFKFFVQDRYGTTYRIYCGYEAPVLGPIKPQRLSAEHDAHEFIIRLRLDHAFCLNILRAVDGLTVNSDISLAYSQRDLARVSWGWQRRIRFYRLDPFAYDFDNTCNNHYPVIRPAHDTASRGMAYHFVPATILLMSDPDPAEVTFFWLDEWSQASKFLDTLALTDEQLAMMTGELKLSARANRADGIKSLLAGLTTGKIVIVRIYDDITPTKREGPEDLPVEEHTPKPYTLGPHEEPGYVPNPVAKSKTEQRKENDKSKAGNKKGFPVDDENANKIFTQALKEQQVLLEAKKKELNEWDLNAQANFEIWFGTTNERDKEIIKQRIDKVLEMSKSYKVSNFRPAVPQYRDAYAYVNPNDKEHYINLGDPFWEASMTGVDSKAGILSHEMSHFTDVGGTDDHAYGTGDSKALAKTNPKKALNNADNFEFYLENAK